MLKGRHSFKLVAAPLINPSNGVPCRSFQRLQLSTPAHRRRIHVIEAVQGL